MPRSSDRHSERTSRRVGGVGVWQHLVALQRIADENGGTGPLLDRGYDASVEYVVAVLRAAGHRVGTCAYPLPNRRRRRSGNARRDLPPDDHELAARHRGPVCLALYFAGVGSRQVTYRRRTRR